VQHAAELAGHEHLTVGGVQQSVAVAETTSGGAPQVAEGAEMAQVITGGVVSTTVSAVLQEAVMPEQDEVAVKDRLTPLLEYALARDTAPLALTE